MAIQRIQGAIHDKAANMANMQIDEEEFKRLVQDDVMRMPDTGIVISGLATKLPMSESLNEFEHNLYEGLDMVSDDPRYMRFEAKLGDLPERAGRLKDIKNFDAEFFGLTQDEADQTDVDSRIMLETVYEAIVDAGFNPNELRGTNTGVFYGVHTAEFEKEVHLAYEDFIPHGYYFQQATKIAQFYDLRGKCSTADSACASGFTAFHQAVSELEAGLVDQALVCAANITLDPANFLMFLQMQMLSPTGYLRFGDIDANGYVKSEGVVAMLLQRKGSARRVYASVMGTATNSDGYKREGITFPSWVSQEALMRSVKDRLKLSVNNIEYYEAHGTGTPAGDPQELLAMTRVYFPNRKSNLETNSSEDKDKKQPRDYEAVEDAQYEERTIGPLFVGSSKSSMGHSEGVSGLAALSKVVLQLENELMYKTLYHDTPNPMIKPLISKKLVIPQQRHTMHAKAVPISCYGFGGSNVHAILRANPKPALDTIHESELMDGEEPRLVVMFGRTQESLTEFFDKIVACDTRQTRYCLSDDFLALVDSVNAKPIDSYMDMRGYVVVDRRGKKELARKIATCVSMETCTATSVARFGAQMPPVCLIFPGYGCTWPGMAAGLRGYTPFWSTIERLAAILATKEFDLIETLTNVDTKQLSNMTGAITASVAYQVALINIVRDQLKTNKLTSFVGHSVGEIACAYASGLIDEREAVLIGYNIGRVLDEQSKRLAGKMVAVGISADEARKAIKAGSSVRVACVNGPESVTISGRVADVDAFLADLATNQPDAYVKVVHESLAFHNETIVDHHVHDEIVKALRRVLLPRVDNCRDGTGWLSTVAGDASNANRKANAEYFANNICKPVEFHAMLCQLSQNTVVMELAPATIFAAQIAMIDAPKLHYVGSMRRDTQAADQIIGLLESVGQLYQAGATFDLSNFYHGKNAQSKLFPVRRQTPSLSSLIKWKHEREFFVPRFPHSFKAAFSTPGYTYYLMTDAHRFLTDHKIEGRALFPATGYLMLAWSNYCQYMSAMDWNKYGHSYFHDIEFREVRYHRAIVMSGMEYNMVVRYNSHTGLFEVFESDSLVCSGYMMEPKDKPGELVYEPIRQRIEAEIQEQSRGQPEFVFSKDDVYKRFRLKGYDYGPEFQRIERATYDGRLSEISYNSHLTAMLDAVLQAGSIGLKEFALATTALLPIGIDYVRLLPSLIERRITDAGHAFEPHHTPDIEGKKAALVSMARAEQDGMDDEVAALLLKKEAEKDAEKEALKKKAEALEPCLFRTYCDMQSGVTISDGIEVRHLRVMPAPKRQDINKPYYECQKFVPDVETPVCDELLTKYERDVQPYARVCDSIALDITHKLAFAALDCRDVIAEGELKFAEPQEIAIYKAEYLKCQVKDYENGVRIEDDVGKPAETVESEQQPQDADENGEEKEKQKDVYSIDRNEPRRLLSVLDQLAAAETLEAARVVAKKNEHIYGRDLLTCAWTLERYLRPIVDLIVDNVAPAKKPKMLEINYGDSLLFDDITALASQDDSRFSVAYCLMHPDLDRLNTKVDLKQPAHSRNKLSTIKFVDDNVDLLKVFNSKRDELSEFDSVIYKDRVCDHLPQFIDEVTQREQIQAELEAIKAAAEGGATILVVTRTKMTVSELLVQSLIELDPEQVYEQPISCKQVNKSLEQRRALWLDAAECAHLQFISEKSDELGRTLLLFHAPAKQAQEVADGQQNAVEPTAEPEIKLIRVQSGPPEVVEAWMSELKEYIPDLTIGNEEDAESDWEDEDFQPSKRLQQMQEKMAERNVVVWLCGVTTRQQDLSGIVGFMRVVRREAGSLQLRCFLDKYSFKYFDEPLTLDTIEQSPKFQEALNRDMRWNCVDQDGNWGAYRHFAISKHLDYDNCLCAEQAPKASDKYKKHMVESSFEQVELTPAVYANTTRTGDLASFAWHESPYKYLSETERDNRVQVAYAALNFRDVMVATGRVNLSSLSSKTALSNDVFIGCEFSGVDARGKRIMGMVGVRGIANELVCTEDTGFALDVPDNISLAEAATVPVVYLTVMCALEYRGKARRGESILIHAGAGGVGQAALHYAHHLGLECYTTVGSQAKRDFLLENFSFCLDDSRIFNSRSTSFEHEVMRATRGRGVDMVLNSLSDELLQASVRCLADGGRFLEIGKYDLMMDRKLELLFLDTNKTFHGIHLDIMVSDAAKRGEKKTAIDEAIEKLKKKVKEGLSEGYIKPIRYETFKAHQVEDAFRHMATGKHIGKVLIEMNPQLDGKTDEIADISPSISCIPRAQFSSQYTYLITGGLGGVGLELAKWLAINGARNIVLSGRRGVRSGYQRSTIDGLRELLDANVRVVTQAEIDASTPDGAKQLVDVCLKESPVQTLGGIFHLAMLLKDTMFVKMEPDDFSLVQRPKVDVCVQLDRVLRLANIIPEYFVVFSSVASGKGNPGQSNYAYANTCAEQVVERRRRDGLPAMAIQWGAIGDVGAAFETFGGNDVVVADTVPQRMGSVLDTLSKFLSSPFEVCLSIVPSASREQAMGGKTDLVSAIFNVLGIKDPTKVSDADTLGKLGLDSLMAVEISQHIEREYDRKLTLKEIRSLTIGKLKEINEKGADAAQDLGTKIQSKGGKQQSAAAAAAGKDPNSLMADKAAFEADQKISERFRKNMGNINTDLTLPRSYKLEFSMNLFRALNSPSTSAGFEDCRPIFVIGPFSGEFSELEMICAHIDRPCIGFEATAEIMNAKSSKEIVELYIEGLRRGDWRTCVPGHKRSDSQSALVLDVMGLHFGVMTALGLMLKVNDDYNSSTAAASTRPKIKPGRLTLLDATPLSYLSGIDMKQIVGKDANEERSRDYLLLGFALGQTRSKASYNFAKLVRRLAKAEMHDKVGITAKWMMKRSPQASQIKPEDREMHIEGLKNLLQNACDRCDVLESYQSDFAIGEGELRAIDCLLIVSEEIQQRSLAKLGDNLGLDKYLSGNIQVRVYGGKRETFLEQNQVTIAKEVSAFF